jgi:hypothetical protein
VDEDVADHRVVVLVAAEVSEDVVVVEASAEAMAHHEVEADRKHISPRRCHLC